MSRRFLNVLPDIAFFGAVVGVYLLDQFAPVIEVVPPLFNYAGWLLVLVGVVLAVRSLALLRKHASSDVVRTSRVLLIHDLFAISRNPLYASELLVITGLAVVSGSLAAFAGPLIYLVIVKWAVIPFEENQLRKKFGAEYEAYVRSVRRWI